ncbi:hypothetical protein GX586_05390 [bacterium]|nr:hypothetical protein [bacterium]
MSTAHGTQPASTPRSRASRAQTIAAGAALAIVLLTAIALRIHRLDADSFWHDELQSACWAARYSIPELLRLGPPPLQQVCFRVISLGGLFSSQLLFRAWSVLCGVLAVAALYRAGARLNCRAFGLGAALLLACHPMHIWHSQQARYYVLAMLLGTVFIERVLAWLDTRRWLCALAAAAAAAGAVLSHFYAALLLPGIALFALLDLVFRKPQRAVRHAAPITLAQIAAGTALFIALLLPTAGAMRSFGGFYARGLKDERAAGARQVVAVAAKPFLSLNSFQERIHGWFFGSSMAFATRYTPRRESRWFFGLFAFGCVGGLFFRRTRRTAVLTALTAYLFAYAQTYIQSGVFYARYVTPLLPVFLLGAANGAAVAAELARAAARGVQRLLRATSATHAPEYAGGAVLVAACAALAASSLGPAGRGAAYDRSMTDHDWRGIGSFVSSNSAHAIVLHAPHRTMSKCLYMYLTGVARHDVDYIAERDILVRRAVSQVVHTPFSLWLQDATPAAHSASPAVHAGRHGPYVLAGVLTVCSNYADAFALLAAADPSWREESQRLVASMRALPPRASLDIGLAAARPYLARGWSGDETAGAATYAWSYDEEAAIVAPVTAGSACDIAFTSRSERSRRVDLYGNGILLTSFVSRTGWERHVFRSLPNQFTNGLNFLSFVFHNLRRRDYEEFETDHRQLGIALDAITITPSDARSLCLGGMIEIGSPADAAFLESGWSHAETWARDGFSYRWIDGMRGSVSFFTTNGTARSMTLRCLPFHPGGAPAQSLHVSCNGISAGEVVLTNGWQEYTIALPFETTSAEMSFEPSACYRPAEHNAGADTRALSIAVDWIVVE